jgi:hypothetical protein
MLLLSIGSNKNEQMVYYIRSTLVPHKLHWIKILKKLCKYIWLDLLQIYKYC